MTHELTVLLYAALLQVAQFVLFSVLANLQVGPKTALGPRDEPIRLTGAAGRAQRAMTNHFEGLILFSIAVFALSQTDTSTTLTQICASTYLIARLLYVPVYLQGLQPWRSLIWATGFTATVLMLITALL